MADTTGLKPTLLKVTPFDASEPHDFQFAYTGNMISSVILFPCAVTGEPTCESTTYDVKIIDTMRMGFTVSEYTFSNSADTIYCIRIAVVEKTSGKQSELSDFIQFRCYAKPQFAFNNVVNDRITVDTATNEVTLSYAQSEGDALDSYQVMLYNGAKDHILLESGIRYDTAQLSFLLTDLADNEHYFVRATGETVSGMVVDTGFVEVIVSYKSSSLFSGVELENLYDDGCISIKSNVLLIEGVVGADFETETYPLPSADGTYDTTDGYHVTFDKKFDTDKGFTASFICSRPSPNTTLLTMENETERMTVSFVGGYFDAMKDSSGTIVMGNQKYCFTLLVTTFDGIGDDRTETLSYRSATIPTEELWDAYEIIIIYCDNAYQFLVREPIVSPDALSIGGDG